MNTKNPQELIAKHCDRVKNLLIQKNQAYGNSVFDPMRIFSKSSTVEQINVRIDDKLSRIARGKNTGNVPEDTVLDLIGYLIIKLVAQDMKETGIIKEFTPEAFAESDKQK